MTTPTRTKRHKRPQNNTFYSVRKAPPVAAVPVGQLATHTIYADMMNQFLTPSNGASQYVNWQRKYYADPVGFVTHCVNWSEGETVAPYQAEILTLLTGKRRVCVRSLHGAGKSTLCALAVLWFALTRDDSDWKVITTASAWRQLTKYLWPEIHKWSRRLRWDIIGREPFNANTELFTLSLQLRTGAAFAVASNDSNYIEGAHADHLLYIFDESKIIPDPTWDSAEGAFSTGDAYWLAVSTPGSPVGRFYDIQSRKPGYEDWSVRHIQLGEAVDAGRIDATWANQRRTQWGAKSQRYRNRVLGEFAQEDINAVIPLDWIEVAQERWLARQEENSLPVIATRIAADIARSGAAKTIFGLRAETILIELQKHEKQDTMQTAGQLHNLLNANPGAVCVVDVIGVGAGSFDRLIETFGPERIVGFIASAHTDYIASDNGVDPLQFVDLRSAAWWYLRELLDPTNERNICLPQDDDMVGDLSAPTYREQGNGRIRVEPKDLIFKRLGRSTDTGDAVVMAFWLGDGDEGMSFA